MESDPREAFWHSRARRVRRKINLAWWLQSFAPIFVGASLASACGILVARTYGWEANAVSTAITITVLVAASAAGAWITARKHFTTRRSALVRIEDHLGIHNALTAADDGVRPWPESADRLGATPDGIGWSTRWVWIPPAIATLLVVIALVLPVAGLASTGAEAGISEPLAWGEVEEMLAQLEEEAIVEPDALEAIEKGIEELRNQPNEEWYSHSSMEAADHQRSRLENGLSSIANEFETAEQALTMLERYDAQLSAAAKERLLEEFADAIAGLEAGDLPIDPELMKSLSEIDPSQLKALSPEQLEELKKRLKEGSKACKSCLGDGAGTKEGGSGWGELEEAELLALINGGKAGQSPGTMPGRGGITRGPGSAPITLSPDETDLGTNSLEAVSNDDLSRALPGDLIGTSTGEHELDTSSSSSSSAGAISGSGSGGQQVWRDTLLPDEKAVLQRYFK